MGNTRTQQGTASLGAHTSSSHYYLNSNCYRIKGLANRRSTIKANHFNNCSRKRRKNTEGRRFHFLPLAQDLPRRLFIKYLATQWACVRFRSLLSARLSRFEIFPTTIIQIAFVSTQARGTASYLSKQFS